MVSLTCVFCYIGKLATTATTLRPLKTGPVARLIIIGECCPTSHGHGQQVLRA